MNWVGDYLEIALWVDLVGFIVMPPLRAVSSVARVVVTAVALGLLWPVVLAGLVEFAALVVIVWICRRGQTRRGQIRPIPYAEAAKGSRFGSR